MFNRKQVAVLGAEFLGTGVLTLVMLSVQHSTIGLPYFVAIAAGLTLAALVSVFYGNGAGHFNPAITLGMWTIRQIRTLRALAYIVAQMLGAWAAYYLYTYFVKTSLQPIGGTYDGRILVAEAVGGLLLSLAFAAAVFNGYSNSKKALTVGAAYMFAIIVAASVTLGIVNPAVAFGERAFDVIGTMGWGTYALGPVLGAVIGFNLYALLFAEESSFVRVRSIMSGRLSRSRTTSAKETKSTAAAEAAETPATSAKAEKPAAKRAAHGRKSKTSRSRK